MFDVGHSRRRSPGARSGTGASGGGGPRALAARRRREEYGTHDYATRYEVELLPLPAFRDLSPEAYREKVAELVREIEEEGERAREGRPVAGVAKILSQDPFQAPSRTTKKSPRLPGRELSTGVVFRRRSAAATTVGAAHASDHEVGVRASASSKLTKR
jgi:hypothetical protein